MEEGRDLAALKRQVDEQLHADVQRYQSINNSLEKSREVTKKMVNILGGFHERLTELEEVIRPVHIETITLTRARDNIRQTLALFSQIEQHHEVSTAVEPILTQSPALQLETYLKALETVKTALEYFEEHNPGHPEKQILTRLQNTGHDFLEREFFQVLERHSFAVDVDELLALPNETIAGVPVLSQDVLDTLRRIANWLAAAERTREITKSYAKVRSGVVTATLASVIDHQSAPKEAKAPRMSMFVTATPKGAGGLKRQTSVGRKTTVRGVSSTSLDEKSALDTDTENRPGAYTKNSHPFITYTRVLLRLLRREALLAAHVVRGDLVAGVLRSVLGPVMDAYISQGELLLAGITKRILVQQYFTCICIFDMIAYMSSKRAEFEKMIMYLDGHDCADRFTKLLYSFADLAKRVLTDFTADVASESGRKLPVDGTVHETTTTALSFVSHVFEYAEVVGNVLLTKRDGILNLETTPESTRATAKWIASVLDALDAHLTKTARLYEQPALSCIFMLNNFDYILRFLGTASFKETLFGQDTQMESYLKDAMANYRQEYLDITWRHVKEVLVIEDYHEGNITKKEKETIKERYSAFNDEFDRIIAEQQAFSVPSEGLRKSLRADNANLLMPLFKRFDMHYRHSGFTTKNPQKYLRFTPDEVQEKLENIFEAVV
eukprot:m.36775 g.36775  ORF g.36775 m.36775 type:complete len:668 (-) comp9718_c0_seq2:26-2029(-)